MIAARAFFALGFLPGALLLAEQQTIPEPLPATRYDKLLEDSPFAVATPTAPVAEPEKPWAENLSLGGVSIETRDGKDIPFVIVHRRGDVTATFHLVGSEPGPDGIELVKIDWADNPAKTTAVLKKGTEFATLKRNEADFNTPPPAPQAPAGRGAGAANALQINNPAAIRRTPPAPGAQAIPRPGVPPAVNAPANPAAQGTERKRIRVIPSQPAAR